MFKDCQCHLTNNFKLGSYSHQNLVARNIIFKVPKKNFWSPKTKSGGNWNSTVGIFTWLILGYYPRISIRRLTEIHNWSVGPNWGYPESESEKSEWHSRHLVGGALRWAEAVTYIDGAADNNLETLGKLLPHSPLNSWMTVGSTRPKEEGVIMVKIALN